MRFIILSFKRNILPITFVVIAFFLVIFSRSNLTAATNGLTIWATCVVPSLFPFFVLTNLLSQTKVVTFLGRFLDKFMKPVFNVPGIAAFPFIMGLVSGYPVGAKIVADFRKEELVTKDEAERMLSFTNNSGPLFILSSVGISLFGDTKIGLLLLVTHVLSCITVGVILGKFSRKNKTSIKGNVKSKINMKNRNDRNEVLNKATNSKNISFKNLGEVLGNSINSSISTILLIGGFVVIFSVIISILNQIHLLDLLSKFINPILGFIGVDLRFAKPVLYGIIELTNGVNMVSSITIKEISQNIILCAFLLGFGGFSVLLQVFSIVSKTDLSMKKYFIGKFMQGIFAAIYTFLALKFIPILNLDIIQTSNMKTNSISSLFDLTQSPIYSIFYEFGFLIVCIIAIIFIFMLFNKLYNKYIV